MTINIKNRTMFCLDNIDVLFGINSNSIDLIYLDPPFNKKKTFVAPIGSQAEGASFKDIFREEDLKDEWVKTIEEDEPNTYNFLKGIKSIEGKKSYNFCYLAYMAIRLVEIRRVMKSTGSIYLHCDSKMSHYLKLLLDYIFGEKNFRNEIIWCYTSGGASKNHFARNHHTILFYSKTNSYTFNRTKYKRYCLRDKKGKEIGKDPRIQYYQDNIGTYRLNYQKDWWDNIGIISPNSKTERTGFPTQKPIALLERIIEASSNEGDVVLDPFCGCATACVAAETLNRQWIGIDVSIKAYELVKDRLKEEVNKEVHVKKIGTQKDLLDWDKEIHYSQTQPVRTDTNGDWKDEKYVYVISNQSFPEQYKIGIAKDWKARLNSYQTSDPNRGYKIEYYMQTHLYRQLEKHIHDKFENNHEWVKADLKKIKEEMEKYES